MTGAGIGCIIMAAWLVTIVAIMAYGPDVETEIDEWEDEGK